jgi:hypothetical protein
VGRKLLFLSLGVGAKRLYINGNGENTFSSPAIVSRDGTKSLGLEGNIHFEK